MHLFLLGFQVNLGFQGIQSDQVVLALHGVLGFQGGQQDRVALDCCYCIRREFGWASCLFCSSDLQVEELEGAGVSLDFEFHRSKDSLNKEGKKV